MQRPTTLTERHSVLDVLRGFALLGVILANMVTHSGYFFLSDAQRSSLDHWGFDHAVEWLMHFLVEGKFYSLFSLLFGIGFALQLKRSGDLVHDFKKMYVRRLLILFLFGLLHAILFYVGDILTVYALLGFTLFFFIKSTDRVLIRGAIILMILPVIQHSILLFFALTGEGSAPPPGDQSRPPMFDQIISVYQTGTALEMIKTSIGGLLFGRYPDLFFTGRFFRVLAMFLVGIYVSRHMLFANLEQNQPLFKKALLISALVGFPCNFILAVIMDTDAYYSLAPMGIIQPLVYAFGVPALCIFYASAIAILYRHAYWRARLNIFAPVGRMALTNYLLQSVICCLIFRSYGLGLFGQVGPAVLTIIGLAIYIFQIGFSYVWLKQFQFGPMEWLWRSMTYKKWQSMKREMVIT